MKFNNFKTTKMNFKKRFGKWEVMECGDMIWDGGRYAIYDYQLAKNDWFIHLSGKTWIITI